ncbi:DUF2628 domain-containing protein [Rhizobium sp. TRM95111]|uniref:DUF2628 domain-containing protein n=1 Tax=Rhizobium alarense TaxID=2846851 RepID=UPI001F434BE8|nr:DUF2628 domain-containing protein [Rhizobium alarense]MCF3642330.1 DUF2628 domain-containing protein [Rhizobium alarense]
MATFLVLTPPGGGPQDEEARFLRDGFSWLALFFPVVWLLWHRAWLAALLAFALQAIGSTLAADPVFWPAGLAVSLGTALLVALEGPTAVVAALRRRGWTLDRAILAEDRDTAEEIYYLNMTDEPAQARPLPVLPASGSSGRAHQPMMGLVGFGEGR